MATMLNVYDLNRKKTAVLQNAYDIVETHQLNQIYTLSFSLPAEDLKAQYCLPRHYVRYGDKGELYRIIKPTFSEDNVNVIKYDCEHVITTLCDNVMFGSYTYGGGSIKTSAVITWLLNQQKTKNWKLGVCEFDRKFEYGWEQENLLNALYSIPKEFAQPYQWTFDTTVYPWVLNLKRIDTTAKPQYYLRAKRNILSSGNAQDYSEICTRIYPLGYGEGVNQLGITEATVNAQGDADENGTRWGKTYIESPQSIIDQYGIVEKVLVDRRFENANSLYAYAKTMLEAYQTPGMSRSFDVTDLYQLTNDSIDKAEVGYITKLTGDGTITYITKTVRKWDIAGDLQIDLSTKSTDIASSIADLADRVRIESVYAQGATQLYQHSKDANAAPSKGKGMVLSLYFPSEMKQINKVLLKLELKKFRYYSSTTSTLPQQVQSTSVDAQKVASTSTQAQRVESTSVHEQRIVSTSVLEQQVRATSVLEQQVRATSVLAQQIQSTSGGSASGETSQSTGGGGGGISVDVSKVSINVKDTQNANWDSFVWAHGGSILNVGVATRTDDYDYFTGSKGKHSHSVSGTTNEVTPPASLDYRHSHSFNTDMASTTENGEHQHTTPLVAHNHPISVYSLVHNHPIDASVELSVRNTQSGYSGFSHSHSFNIGGHTHTVTIPKHEHTVTIPKHDHTVTIPKHEHTVTIPKHEHTVTIPKHDHTVTIPKHEHTVTIPKHEHTISPNIYESTENPTGYYVYVNGKKLTNFSTISNGTVVKCDSNGLMSLKNFDGDITSWILNDKNQVPRGSWINLEIVPNALAYVVSSVFVQGFVQSRGGGNY